MIKNYKKIIILLILGFFITPFFAFADIIFEDDFEEANLTKWDNFVNAFIVPFGYQSNYSVKLKATNNPGQLYGTFFPQTDITMEFDFYVICDPEYPEIFRPFFTLNPDDWHLGGSDYAYLVDNHFRYKNLDMYGVMTEFLFPNDKFISYDTWHHFKVAIEAETYYEIFIDGDSLGKITEVYYERIWNEISWLYVSSWLGKYTEYNNLWIDNVKVETPALNWVEITEPFDGQVFELGIVKIEFNSYVDEPHFADELLIRVYDFDTGEIVANKVFLTGGEQTFSFSWVLTLPAGEYKTQATLLRLSQPDIFSDVVRFSIVEGLGYPEAPIYSPFIFNYIDYSPFDEPTGTFTSLVNNYNTLLYPFFKWSNFFSQYFITADIETKTASFTEKINLVRSYLKSFDNFFGGLPMTFIFSMFLMITMAKVVFTILTRIIQAVKP